MTVTYCNNAGHAHTTVGEAQACDLEALRREQEARAAEQERLRQQGYGKQGS